MSSFIIQAKLLVLEATTRPLFRFNIKFFFIFFFTQWIRKLLTGNGDGSLSSGEVLQNPFHPNRLLSPLSNVRLQATGKIFLRQPWWYTYSRRPDKWLIIWQKRVARSLKIFSIILCVIIFCKNKSQWLSSS